MAGVIVDIGKSVTRDSSPSPGLQLHMVTGCHRVATVNEVYLYSTLLHYLFRHLSFQDFTQTVATSEIVLLAALHAV